jgi:hypothetical protein
MVRQLPISRQQSALAAWFSDRSGIAHAMVEERLSFSFAEGSSKPDGSEMCTSEAKAKKLIFSVLGKENFREWGKERPWYEFFFSSYFGPK